ncbi:MAG TPA: cytochrome c [Burkholderiaceae bacterium]|nr:cytochrome c [Burkholderiaceae bacterium]HQR72452.1 cytochrome c [Burkholderiaceae bacterium]
MIRFLIATVLAIVSASAIPAEQSFKLKDGKGMQQVVANCSVCHSVDYIMLNSPFLDRKGWDAEVTKMIKAFGAPVKPEDTAVIVDYLVTNYGVEAAK